MFATGAAPLVGPLRTLGLPGRARDIALDGGYAYVADSDAGLFVLYTGDDNLTVAVPPTAPPPVPTVPTGPTPPGACRGTQAGPSAPATRCAPASRCSARRRPTTPSGTRWLGRPAASRGTDQHAPLGGQGRPALGNVGCTRMRVRRQGLLGDSPQQPSAPPESTMRAGPMGYADVLSKTTDTLEVGRPRYAAYRPASRVTACRWSPCRLTNSDA